MARYPALQALIAVLGSAACSGTARGGEGLMDSAVVGLLSHNVHHHEARGIDANLELRLNLPVILYDGLDVLPAIGGTAHFGDGASLGYGGALLRYQHESGLYAEGFFGLATHDAETPADPNEADLGCGLLFREAGEVGYRWRSNQIGAHIAHYSHGNLLCGESENEGLTQIGVRYGYRF